MNLVVDPLHELDEFALLADQTYNYGNNGDWFSNFRKGLYGYYSRANLARELYEDAHSMAGPWTTEGRLAAAFFAMDSMAECLVFAVNALGFGTHPTLFRDVSDRRQLRLIGPSDLLEQRVRGYPLVFPAFTTALVQRTALLKLVFDQHDVSKHRGAEYIGGNVDPGLRATKILLNPTPKAPLIERAMQTLPSEQLPTFEGLAADFGHLMSDAAVAALSDAREHIPLKEQQFRQ